MIPRYYPEMQVRAKLGLAPVVAVIFAVSMLHNHGVIDLNAGPPTSTTRPAARGASSAPPSCKAAPPSRAARAAIPADALAAYCAASKRWCPRLSWAVLAGIGKQESAHGRSSAPGVHSGVNWYGCCRGPMQFNTEDGPPSTWQQWHTDGDGDGRADIYNLRDATASAARKLCGDWNRTGSLRGALLAYNADAGYVARALALARHYQAGGR